MGLKRTDEFRQDAVRISLTSGLTPKASQHTHAFAPRKPLASDHGSFHPE